MKVYLVETVKDLGSPGYDIDLVNISSTFQNAIFFIKKFLEDSNCEIESEDDIQITEETIDAYFDGIKFLGIMTARQWIDNYETVQNDLYKVERIFGNNIEPEEDQEEISCYDLQS